MELTTASDTLPFLLQLPCYGWAQACYLMNAGSIANHLQNSPLNPAVAVGHFWPTLYAPENRPMLRPLPMLSLYNFTLPKSLLSSSLSLI